MTGPIGHEPVNEYDQATMRDLTSDLAEFLLGPAAQKTLERLTASALPEHETLKILLQLRREFPPEQAAALLDQARLRHQARTKFARADRMFFTDEALQQASGETIATYRARRFTGFDVVADLGCGIGGDSIALGLVVRRLIGIDLDRVRLRFARANVAANEIEADTLFVEADWSQLQLDVEAAFADPARRVDGRRVFSLNEMQPPLQALLELQQRTQALGVKVAPGVSDNEIPLEAEVEFISERGTLKEAVLWFGPLRTGAARQATLLPSGVTMNSRAPVAPRPTGPPRAFLHEPDPAVLRATLVEHLATELDAGMLDPTIAYLTTDKYTRTPFARSWRVIEDAPFNQKELNRRLRRLEADVIAVKKRGSPIEPEQFRKQLKSIPGARPVTVFITRVDGRPWMILTETVEPQVTSN